MADSNQLKIGDVVKLKSGGPKMTVTYVGDKKAVCMWFAYEDKIQQEICKAEIALGALEKEAK